MHVFRSNRAKSPSPEGNMIHTPKSLTLTSTEKYHHSRQTYAHSDFPRRHRMGDASRPGLPFASFAKRRTSEPANVSKNQGKKKHALNKDKQTKVRTVWVPCKNIMVLRFLWKKRFCSHRFCWGDLCSGQKHSQLEWKEWNVDKNIPTFQTSKQNKTTTQSPDPNSKPNNQQSVFRRWPLSVPLQVEKYCNLHSLVIVIRRVTDRSCEKTDANGLRASVYNDVKKSVCIYIYIYNMIYV